MPLSCSVSWLGSAAALTGVLVSIPVLAGGVSVSDVVVRLAQEIKKELKPSNSSLYNWIRARFAKAILNRLFAQSRLESGVYSAYVSP